MKIVPRIQVSLNCTVKKYTLCFTKFVYYKIIFVVRNLGSTFPTFNLSFCNIKLTFKCISLKQLIEYSKFTFSETCRWYSLNKGAKPWKSVCWWHLLNKQYHGTRCEPRKDAILDMAWCCFQRSHLADLRRRVSENFL